MSYLDVGLEVVTVEWIFTGVIPWYLDYFSPKFKKEMPIYNTSAQFCQKFVSSLSIKYKI